MIWGKAKEAWERLAKHEADKPDRSGFRRKSPYFIGSQVHPDSGEYDSMKMASDRQATLDFEREVAARGNGDWVEWRPDGIANVWGRDTQIQVINGMYCAVQV